MYVSDGAFHASILQASLNMNGYDKKGAQFQTATGFEQLDKLLVAEPSFRLCTPLPHLTPVAHLPIAHPRRVETIWE